MARGFRNYENMVNLIYLKCSDVVVPLNNRFQLSTKKNQRNKREKYRDKTI